MSLRRSVPAGYRIVDMPRPGYDAAIGTNHEGIAIIFSNSFISRILPVSFQPHSFELLLCHFCSSFYKFILVIVYRPSCLTVTETFFNEFTNLLELIASYNSMVILTGDFNIHVDDVNDNSALRLADLLDAFGLLQHVRGSTHVRRHTIDLLITLPTCSPTIVNVKLPGIISDHSLVTCTFALQRPTLVQRHLITRQLNSIDGEAFFDAVRRSSICADIGQLVDYSCNELRVLFHAELWLIVDDFAPSVHITTTVRFALPWVDGGCAASRRHARALERRYR